MERREVDAVVVGAGPNGLAAAILLRQQGLSVLLVEGSATAGGGMRSLELTLPGFIHDVCSAVHPLAAVSPFFSRLPLQEYGLSYIYPDIDLAHPMDDHSAATLVRSPELTAAFLGNDADEYLRLIQPVITDFPALLKDILGPMRLPRKPGLMARFGFNALLPASRVAKKFRTQRARGFWAGLAAHSILPLDNWATSAIGIVLAGAGHVNGWPFPKGGAGKLADSLANYYLSLGGSLETGWYISSLAQLPSAHAYFFDVTPRQLLTIAGHKFSSVYQWQLHRYRYGMGVYKVDWALGEPAPFTATACRRAGTLHLGNSFEEIAQSEKMTAGGACPGQPFVLFSQPTVFDPSRSPQGKHTAWAYCHVPHGSAADMTAAIEKQVERFAPGFRERIIARHTMDSAAMEQYNHNYIGGDINGGSLEFTQLFTRPALRWSPYRTSARGLYLCSSSTPPGPGVHGMSGYHAARQALRDIFGIRVD